MKWINPGMAEFFDSAVSNTTVKSYKSSTGFYVNMAQRSKFYKNINSSEIWFSYDFALHLTTDNYDYYLTHGYFLNVIASSGTRVLYVRPVKKSNGVYLGVYDTKDNLLYTSEKTFVNTDDVWHNIEFHVKTGENGRIDIWLDTKLFCSFRSPSAFNWEMNSVGISVEDITNFEMYASSFILQDTRRIGLEKFKKLTIDPDTEQNMPQGSTTTYKLSGLSDATEFSDITSVCAVLQATSRDANISTGTFSLEGADVGTIDVSDSSGKAYEIAHAETNSLTGKPWTRDDIEGKTLSFKVNGAS